MTPRGTLRPASGAGWPDGLAYPGALGQGARSPRPFGNRMKEATVHMSSKAWIAVTARRPSHYALQQSQFGRQAFPAISANLPAPFRAEEKTPTHCGGETCRDSRP